MYSKVHRAMFHMQVVYLTSCRRKESPRAAARPKRDGFTKWRDHSDLHCCGLHINSPALPYTQIVRILHYDTVLKSFW